MTEWSGDFREKSVVSVSRAAQTTYPASPFHPPEIYPELSGLGSGSGTIDPSNHIYGCVRESLRLLGLDADHYGTAQWNPLGDIVRPGDRVVLKPNWVMHRHDRDESWEQVITHGAVIRPAIDYVQRALEGHGSICLADGPMLSADFGEICRRAGIQNLRRHYDGLPGLVPLEVLDLRSMLHETKDAVVIRRHELSGDPRGSVVVDLASHSVLHRFKGEGRYYGADYDMREVNQHHRGELQEYQISRTAMDADVLIDIPKLKSHHKVGVTLALKGVVGLNCGRNWLPHRTQGTPRQGGDQFQASGVRQQAESLIVRTFEHASLRFPRTVPGLYRVAKTVGKRVFGESHRTIRGGGWYGNNTLWRMVHDINRALMYGDVTGSVQSRPTKRRFCIVDGIVAGEGMGPTSPDPVACGVVLAGFNPVAVDLVGAELMGFDHTRIPQIIRSFDAHSLPLVSFDAADIEVASNVAEWCGQIADLRAMSPYAFAPPLGWNNYIERHGTSSARVG